MGGLFRILIILLVIFAGFVVIILWLLKVLMGKRSHEHILERDSEILTDSLDQFIEGMIEPDRKELKLLSVAAVSKKKSKSPTGAFVQGMLSTIYQEPIIAYCLKTYASQNDYLITFRTLSNSYTLSSHERIIKVFKNGTQFGTIEALKNVFSLYDLHKGVICKVEKEGSSFSLKKDLETIAQFTAKNSEGKFESDRLFSLLEESKDTLNEDHIIILSVYYLLVYCKKLK